VLPILAGSLSASESVYPLWDGQESVADYARRSQCGVLMQVWKNLVNVGSIQMRKRRRAAEEGLIANF
jgi:hypothetical protein